MHGIKKKWNAPIINWDARKEKEKKKNKVVQYLDSIIITINSNINAVIPKRHPCQKRTDKINYDL
jgi:hypothetical protein